jgi:hypothetical protein
MQLNFTNDLPRGIHGGIATLRQLGDRSRTLAKRKHRVQIALGGADNGTYSYSISTPSGFDPATAVSVSHAASGSTADAILTALAAAHNANSAGLLGVARATADLAGDDLYIEAVRSGEPFTVTLTSNPETNMVLTTVVNAAETTARPGYAMADVDGFTCRPLQNGDTAATIAKLGILVAVPPVEADENGDLVYGEGQDLFFVNDGDLWIMPEVDMAVTDPVYVRVVATGNEIAGAIRNTADSSDAVQMTRWQVLQAGGPTSGNPILLGVYP